MIKQLLAIAFAFFGITAAAQTNFENGYFIDKDGNTVTCLIKNLDWQNNPQKFTYKLTADGAVQTEYIDRVSEFGINNISKYKRFLVEIDRSSEDISLMTSNPKPVFKTEQLFLKVLVEGDASLYYFEDATVSRYFYGIGPTTAEQLIYKKYKTAESIVTENNGYRSQLAKLKCNNITDVTLNNLQYNKSLVKFFESYNSCVNKPFTTFGKKSNKGSGFHLSVRPGINHSSLSTNLVTIPNGLVDYGSKTTFRMGVEAEYVLPFNNNKWAIIFEPTYQYFKTSFVQNNKTVTSDYKSLEFPLGVRYYLFLNDDSKAFLNAAVVYDAPFSSKLTTTGNDDLTIDAQLNPAFGAGYKFKNKYSVELRYGLSRRILSTYRAWESSYKTLSVIFGYTIF